MSRRRAWCAIALLMLVVGCGGDPAAPPQDDISAAPGSEAGAPSDIADVATVATARSDLGVIVVDAEGITLYRFDNDSAGEPTCYDDCETNWPPLLIEGESPAAGDGADASLLGTTKRTDGTTQVTYADQPLYYFAGDEAPGDINGQGVGDIWWTVAPDGAAMTEANEQPPGGRDY